MKALIGTKEPVKFIFFRVDKDESLPTISEVKKTLKTKSANYYKSSGYYGQDISIMSDMLDLIHNGLALDSELYQSWGGSYTKCISVALRVDQYSQRNSFFDLKYSDIIIDHLVLSNESFSQLASKCNDALRFLRKLKEVHRLYENIYELDALINKKEVRDKTLKEASNLLNLDALKNLGKPSMQIAEKNFCDWYSKYKWID
jgi:hypothetical protein